MSDEPDVPVPDELLPDPLFDVEPPPRYIRTCWGCYAEFETTTKPSGSKWSNLCPSCLQHEL